MEVIVTGGRIQSDSQASVGAYAIRLLDNPMWTFIFWCVCSLHHQIGVTSLDYFECEVKRAMVNCSDRIVALTGHNKVGTFQKHIKSARSINWIPSSQKSIGQ
ncbi:MAG: hypothetical protein WDM78_13830 [Puia sp.]